MTPFFVVLQFRLFECMHGIFFKRWEWWDQNRRKNERRVKLLTDSAKYWKVELYFQQKRWNSQRNRANASLTSSLRLSCCRCSRCWVCLTTGKKAEKENQKFCSCTKKVDDSDVTSRDRRRPIRSETDVGWCFCRCLTGALLWSRCRHLSFPLFSVSILMMGCLHLITLKLSIFKSSFSK